MQRTFTFAGMATIFVSPMLHRMIESFITPQLFASLKTLDDRTMDDGKPVRGFYLAHPWEHDTPSVPMLATMRKLPVYLVIDEDQRILGRYAIEDMPAVRGAVVHARLD